MKVNKKSKDFTSFNIADSQEAKENERVMEEVTSTKYDVVDIPLEDIEFNPKNTRFNDEDTDESISEFAEHLSDHDLVHPIAVFPHGDKYMLISGERRTRAYKMLNRRTIKATIFPYTGDMETMEMLYEANLQSRMLSPRVRFLAYKDLCEEFEAKSKTVTGDDLKKLAKILQTTTAALNKCKELYQRSEEADIELLKNNDITFDEFVQRTKESFAKRELAQQKRIEIISKKTENIAVTNYYDPESKTVYSIERDKNGEYCTAVTDANLYKVPLHIQNQVFKTFEEAQVSLDFFAISKNLLVYEGDFSEYTATVAVSSPPSDTISDHSSEDNTENNEINEEDYGHSLIVDEAPTQRIGCDGEPSDDNDHAEKENDESADSDESTTSVKLNNDNVAQADNSTVNNDMDASSESAQSKVVTEEKHDQHNADYLNHLVRHTGYCAEDRQKYTGSLYIKGTHTYIMFDLAVDIGKETGKATKKTIAQYVEVEPESIQMIHEV